MKEEFSSKYEILDHDTMQTDQKVGKIERIVKKLNEERLDNVGFADRKIQSHIKKGLEHYDKGLEIKLNDLHKQIHDLKEPVDQKLLNLQAENEGMSRQNLKFIQLYRECLTDLQSEIKEKKLVLDTSQLAFLTSDPGLI